MSTYAEYRMWVGITIEECFQKELDEKAEAFIEKVQNAWKPIKINGLLIESIEMHGETVGLGVIIHELGWEVEIGRKNVFNPEVIAKAQKTQIRLNGVFDKVGIPLQAVIYQHIDLGG